MTSGSAADAAGNSSGDEEGGTHGLGGDPGVSGSTSSSAKFSRALREKAKRLYDKYTWRVNEVSRIGEEFVYSDVFFIGGYSWRLLLYPRGNNNKSKALSVYLTTIVRSLNRDSRLVRLTNARNLNYDSARLSPDDSRRLERGRATVCRNSANAFGCNQHSVLE